MSPTNSDNPPRKPNSVELAFEAIQTIANEEPEMADQLLSVLTHVAGTYSDKYAEAEKTGGYDTKKFDLYHRVKGKIINLYQLRKYVQRYETAGFGKSNNPVDLFKAIHYLLFELVRRRKYEDEGEVTDSKVSN